MPGLGRLSGRDRAKALPALHAKMELHLLNHAAFTRFCSRSGTDSAFAFARLRRKWAVSSDHRPPVSAPNTTRRARPPSPTNSGYVVSFLRRASSRATPPCGSPPRTPIPPERRHQRGVDSQLSSLPQGQPVCDHLDPSSIEDIGSSHVEVAHEGVWGHPGPSLAAHLGCSTLKRKHPLSKKTLPRSTLLDDGQFGLVGGHIGMCERTRARASGGVCTAGCGKVGPQILVILLVGIVEKTADAKGSRWECIKAFSASVRVIQCLP